MFEKSTRKVKGHITDKPDPPKTHPDPKKEKQDRCSEIASVFQEQFALRDEKEWDYAKFKSLIDELSVNVDKKKPARIANGAGTFQDKTYELCALYKKMNAGRT